MATIRIAVIELVLDKDEVANAIGAGVSSAMREMMAAKAALPHKGKSSAKAKAKAKPKAKKAKKK